MAQLLKSITFLLISTTVLGDSFPLADYQKFRHVDKLVKKFHVSPKWKKDNSGFHFYDHQKEEIKFFDQKTFKTNTYLKKENIENLKNLISYILFMLNKIR